ncbi:TPA: hypothetical protein DEF17_07480 [bacterium]|nr:MAG: hypothetical protein COS94_03910 [Candidatus Hydrogenedentes bacterium CG07_land_8_20_14_0_80_42_17]HBW47756.1 hypothetical protein [bacterium]
MIKNIDLMNLRAGARIDLEKASAKKEIIPEKAPGADIAQSFKSLLENKVNDLVAVTQESDKLDRDFEAGKTEDVHQVMVAAAKSQLAIDTALQVRNLAIRAFTSLTQLR